MNPWIKWSGFTTLNLLLLNIGVISVGSFSGVFSGALFVSALVVAIQWQYGVRTHKLKENQQFRNAALVVIGLAVLLSLVLSAFGGSAFFGLRAILVFAAAVALAYGELLFADR